MNKSFLAGCTLCAIALIIVDGTFAAPGSPGSSILARAHAHNDYEHARPLLDALDRGFCSVEADIHLVEGELLVAHDPEEVRGGRTLQKLYLDPLRERARQNGGRVHRGGPPLILLVDIKTAAEPTYQALREVLKDYADILTRFTPDSTTENAVTIIVSGNRPRAFMQAEERRWAAFDGRASDLKGPESIHFMPLVSDNWRLLFTWRGEGPFPQEEKSRLAALVGQAHAQGRKIRLWATPDRPEVWNELFSAGVDLINTDDLSGLRDFLLKKAAENSGQP